MTWDSVTEFGLKIQGNFIEAPIYANGRNSIGITVTLTPQDENHKDIPGGVTIKAGKNLLLIDYLTGFPLAWNGSNGWCYSDQPTDFNVVPPGGRVHVSEAADDGSQQVTLYVWCNPGVSAETIGAWVTTDTGKVFRISPSSTSFKGNYVALDPQTAIAYGQNDLKLWNTGNLYPQDSSVWVCDWYMSCDESKRPGFHFTKFDVDTYCTADTDPGLAGWYLGDKWAYLDCLYVWPDGNHTSTTKRILDYVRDTSYKDVPVYQMDQAQADRSQCFTWAFKRGAKWAIVPQGCIDNPLTQPNYFVFYPTTVTAYDQYGNSGTFWPDTRHIVNPPDAPNCYTCMNFNIYDYNPNANLVKDQETDGHRLFTLPADTPEET